MKTKGGTLAEIRSDGAHRVRLDDGGVEWLTGFSRASKARVGDRLTLEYRTGRTYGLWFARREADEAVAS